MGFIMQLLQSDIYEQLVVMPYDSCYYRKQGLRHQFESLFLSKYTLLRVTLNSACSFIVVHNYTCDKHTSWMYYYRGDINATT